MTRLVPRDPAPGHPSAAWPRLRAGHAQALLALYATIIFVVVARALYEQNQLIHPYIVGDWLINYAGGFVRRGVFGELVLALADWTDVRPRTVVLAVQYTAYAVFLAAAVPVVGRAVAKVPAFAFLAFSPLVFSFPALDPTAAGRKEILLFAVLAVQAWLVAAGPTTEGPRWFAHRLGVAVSAIFLVLSHEMLVLFVPFQLLLLSLAAPRPVAMKTLVATGAPAALAFVLCCLYKGSVANVLAICASLGAEAPPKCEKAGAIAWIGWTTVDGVKSVYYQVVQPPYIATTTAVSFVLAAVPFAFLALHAPTADLLLGTARRWVPTPVQILCAVAPLPAFVVASDHGRWLHAWVTAATITLAALLGRASATREDVLAPRTERAPSVGMTLAALASVALLAAYSLSWHTPGNCCPSGLGTGFLGELFRSLPF